MLVMYLVMLIFVLLSVAFLTLFERKILGYIQIRKGPDKLIMKGFFQPISDAVKLFSKEKSMGLVLNKYMYLYFSILSLYLMLLIWLIYSFNKIDGFYYSVIYFLLVSGMTIYWLMGSSWASNSKYALLGCYRSGAQVVSYEVGFIFLCLVFFESSYSYSLLNFLTFQENANYFIFVFWFLYFLWVVIILAELNRSPFDFAESESELVSGFNIEYGGAKFAFLFLAEYGSILFMSFLSMMVFFTKIFILMIVMLFVFIWVRGVFPRYRYDNLMYLNWKIFLPFILMIFVLMIFIKNILM
uniref:NADH-ubiquinone oxidoreductase chain 1 n=1 Tax=Neoseiulus womersleyi TaxID=322050 RepID=A0A8F6YE56_9ACAR|nr:NADH dehydrogenase subunit 1 [Neoseiulus womersleyi]